MQKTPLSLVREVAQRKLDSLEEMDLGMVDQYTDRTPVVFTAVPCLRKFRMLSMGATRIAVPWAQLAELSLDCDSLDWTIEILAQSTNLVKAYINPHVHPSQLPGHITPLRFSQLHSLSLCLTEHLTPLFLDNLSTPVLQKLELMTLGPRWTQLVASSFAAFQLRAPNITRLQFSCRFAVEELASIIRRVPSLTHLNLTDCKTCFNDDFIRILHYDQDVAPLAPSLHHLVVCNLFVPSFTDDVLGGTHIEDAHRISQVCSDWRQIAHGTPRLWARTLEVDLCAKRNVADGLKAWLTRSAPLPISLSFISWIEDTNHGFLEEVLKVLPRCGSLRVIAARWFIGQLSQCRLDSLENLDLGMIDETEPIMPTLSAPRLRKLNVCTINRCLPPSVVPWAQLTDLELECDSSDGIVEVLSQCIHLVKASIVVHEWSPLEVRHTIPFQLSQLRSLDLHFMADNTLLSSYLSTPVLQELQLPLCKL
ncbi:F-box domain-containing protein [Mycena sanguinolenta]|uniref:F-box domain-containing protein n=1 Tax=Mycena sanguinolenta TaxID=230812 RepID=A0A8H6YF04_9AGAR|nr:F-box domain-containing protein [Mycena sanguinolenta]